jgi:hypothetical protein
MFFLCLFFLSTTLLGLAAIGLACRPFSRGFTNPAAMYYGAVAAGCSLTIFFINLIGALGLRTLQKVLADASKASVVSRVVGGGVDAGAGGMHEIFPFHFRLLDAPCPHWNDRLRELPRHVSPRAG